MELHDARIRPQESGYSPEGGEIMNSIRSWALAAGVCGLLAGQGQIHVCQAGEPLTVRPAVYQSSTPLNVTPVFHRHYGSYGYRSYGSYGYGGYRGYGYYGGYAPRYGYGYGYGPSVYSYSSYRPYYAHPVGYYRAGYYSYPSYRTFAYPYSYGGLYTTGYYGGGVSVGYGGMYAPSYSAGYVSAPVVASPVISTPYVYGGYYNYPQYANTCGCAW